MPSTPRFHRRKHSRGSSSPSSRFTHLRPSSRNGTPTRTTPTRNNHGDTNDEEEAAAVNHLQQQQPVSSAQHESSQTTTSATRTMPRGALSHTPRPRALPPLLPPPPPDLLDGPVQEGVDQASSWVSTAADPEQLFSSPELDEDISIHSSHSSAASSSAVEESTIWGDQWTVGGGDSYLNFSSKFPPLFPETGVQNALSKDDETCNNTVLEIKKQRSKKAVRASTVGAFNTFLKALFGIGMLSNPAVLGEVGLVLGTFCHLFIIVGCAFACYLLLTARQLAVEEVRCRERMEAEEYDEWVRRRSKEQQRELMENRVQTGVVGNRRKEQQQQLQWNIGGSGEFDTPLRVGGRPLMQGSTNAAANATPDGWGRIQNSMMQASGEVLSPACAESCSGRDPLPPPPPLIDDWEGENHARDPLPPPPLLIDDWEDENGAIHDTTAGAAAGAPSPQFTNAIDKNNNFESIASPPSLQRKTGHRRNRSHQHQLNTPTIHFYHRFEDTHRQSSGSLARLSSNNTPIPILAPPKKSKQIRLVTYGDVAKYLAGPTFAQLMIFTIVSVHLMFASGMLHIAVENLCYIAGWDRLGFSYTDVMYTGDDDWYYGNMRRRLEGNSHDNNDHNSGSRSNDNRHSGSRSRDRQEWHSINIEEAEEEYAKWEGPDFIGRLAMASLLFPIIHGLLQIPSLKELATISTMGLVTYALGCIGSMMYSAFVLTDFEPFADRPDDILQFKWSGIPTYVATTIYAIEGINLALPTVNTLEGSDRAGNKRKGGKEGDKTNSSIKMVVTAVFCYGCVTLFVSWMGLAGGLGGGIGTIHEQEGCRDVTYCLNSVKVQYVYMLSLGVALVLTLPVILYPSTEMLEIWLDERADEKRRKLEREAEANNVPNYEDLTTKQLKYIRRGILEAEALANNVSNPEKMTTKQLKAVRRHIRSKSLMDDDTIAKLNGGNDNSTASAPEEGVYIEMTTINNNAQDAYSPPSCSPACNAPDDRPASITDVNVNTRPNPPTKDTSAAEERKVRAKRKLKYWKLRMFLAFLICFIGTLEGSFPQIVRAAEVIRGVGLSMAGLISPPLLYMSAVGGRFSAGMASAMALLIGLGLFNIVLVLMSAFGGKDYIIEEGPGHYHDSFYELDE
ncbi:hypothetical protein ACHAWO_003876 [Cyclotella atomus]|uniref:Amino acid transporter transmembrane domain-containing protein n=1 Tax=Cyclotella atomus TaxID=382360 RepID=A0ABD3MRC1_9STRA